MGTTSNRDGSALDARRWPVWITGALAALGLVFGSGLAMAQAAHAAPTPARPASAAAAAAPTDGGYVGIAPLRLLDTRFGTGRPTQATTPVPAHGTVTVEVAGHAGIPATGVNGVSVSLAAVASTRPGYLTAYPAGAARPGTSTVNFPAGGTHTNSTFVAPGSAGAVTVYNGSTGTVHVLLDVSGYIADAAAGTPAAVVTLGAAVRLVDTRPGLGVAPGGDYVVGLSRAGIPATSTGVFVNLTAVGPQRAGYLSVRPIGAALGTSSQLNFLTGDVVSNHTLVALGTGSQFIVHNGSGGRVNLLVDVSAYLQQGSGTGQVAATTPGRVLDTRTGQAPVPAVPEHSSMTYAVDGKGGLPDGSETRFAVMNLTATDASSPGYLNVHVPSQGRPQTSNLNVVPGRPTAALVFVPLEWSSQGDGLLTAVYNGSTKPVAVIADILGYVHGPMPTQGWLSSVSCSSPRYCLALDTYGNAMSYDGTSWSPPARMTGGRVASGRVSCPADGACAVVSGGLPLRWDGRAWQDMGHPAGNLADISCPTSTVCVAGDEYGRAFRWSGGVWSPPVRVSKGTWQGIRRVSCPTTSMCAVTLPSSTTLDADAAVYSGGSWGPVTAMHGGSDAIDPGSLDCATPTFCVVATYLNMVYVYDGTSWVANAPPDFPDLPAVSCATATRCHGLGRTDGVAVDFVFDGAGWSWTPLPVGTPWSWTDLSCSAATSCVGIGGDRAMVLGPTGWGPVTTIDPTQ